MSSLLCLKLLQSILCLGRGENSKPARNYHAGDLSSKSNRFSKRKAIYFYDENDPHWCFTNFSPHAVRHNNRFYPTSEHLFQATKFLGSHPDIAEKIRTTSQRPSDAFNLATTYQEFISPRWYDENIGKMYEVLQLKFSQHDGIKQELLSTGNKELIMNSPNDTFWGVGMDGKGRNELGKALMRLRATLQDIDARALMQEKGAKQARRTK